MTESSWEADLTNGLDAVTLFLSPPSRSSPLTLQKLTGSPHRRRSHLKRLSGLSAGPSFLDTARRSVWKSDLDTNLSVAPLGYNFAPVQSHDGSDDRQAETATFVPVLITVLTTSEPAAESSQFLSAHWRGGVRYA